MISFNKALLQSMLELVQERFPEAIEIVSYDEVDKSDGYCDTCYYEWTEVEIFYLTSEDATPRMYNYSGDFGQLIRRLTEND